MIVNKLSCQHILNTFEGTNGQTIVALQLEISTELNINLRPVQRKHFVVLIFRIKSVHYIHFTSWIKSLNFSKGSASGGRNKFGVRLLIL